MSNLLSDTTEMSILGNSWVVESYGIIARSINIVTVTTSKELMTVTWSWNV